MTRLEQAIELAVRAHAGQMDEDGHPHIVHCMEVMLAVKNECERWAEGRRRLPYEQEELMIAAILHDTVEDSKGMVTLEYIKSVYGQNVHDIVDGVTRRGLGKGETKEFYRDFIYRAKANKGATLLKIEDLNHNRGRTHKIAASKAKWRAKLEFKYTTALRVLHELSTTWEQASWNVSYDQDEAQTAHFFVADPDGKRIEVTQAEFNSLLGR